MSCLDSSLQYARNTTTRLLTCVYLSLKNHIFQSIHEFILQLRVVPPLIIAPQIHGPKNHKYLYIYVFLIVHYFNLQLE